MTSFSSSMDSQSHEIAFELLPIIPTYKDGRVERLIKPEIVPLSLEYPKTGVSSEDITISSTSVEYRKAPEFPLPTAYDDCWDALQWVASHSSRGSGFDEPWLTKYGDFDRLFSGGDSAATPSPDKLGAFGYGIHYCITVDNPENTTHW
ncbi:hypothetical protein IFM89_037531 [Coptis chinensis]|uniref:Alpha/beta hydrolase fold-3 domain-containing protein n=1 Tax=Coptis chinensis TaxID=261450 RepID=A0A835I1Z7_9MAGN|nr:hypothetical protein IFM89_037531 [Coptis chinensis]